MASVPGIPKNPVLGEQFRAEDDRGGLTVFTGHGLLDVEFFGQKWFSMHPEKMPLNMKYPAILKHSSMDDDPIKLSEYNGHEMGWFDPYGQ